MSDLELFLLGLISKWTILLAIFWIANWSLPRTSLTPRVWVWRAALLVSLGVTIVTLLQPLAQVPLLATIETPAPKIIPARNPSKASGAPTTPTNTLAPVDKPKQPSPFADAPLNITPVDARALADQLSTRRWSSIFIMVWIVVSAWLVARLMMIIWRDERFRRDRELIDGPVREQFDQLLNELGQVRHQCVPLYWSSVIDSPVATGILRPAILLPQSLRAADAVTLRSALAHELSHIASRDIAWSLALRLWQALAWVCPLIWLVPRQHHEACELLADHQASQSLANRADYRQILATLALNLLAPSAKRVPRGAAISMLRTPMILHRLNMLESTAAHAHVNLLTRLIFSLICIVGLLLGGIGVARTRAQEATATKPQLIETRPVIVSEDANNKAEDAIRILAPDGSPAKEVRMVLGPNRYRGGGLVCLSEDTKNFPVKGSFVPGGLNVRQVVYKPIILTGEAIIQRSQIGDEDSVIVWNDLGFHQFMLSPLSWPKEVKLQPWSSLDLLVLNGDQPLAKCEIEVNTRSASDGIHQATEVLVIGQTDDQGRLTLPRVPPGAVIISRKTVMKSFQSTTTTISPRSTTVLLHPGEVLEVKQGGGGQRVEGKLQLSGYLPEAFVGELSINDWQERINFQIESDGSFTIDDVPPGKHELRFRLLQPFKFFANHSFQCAGNRSDPPMSVGTIEPKDDRGKNEASQPVGEGIKRDWMPSKLTLSPASAPVRMIDYSGGPTGSHYVMRGAEGQVLLNLTDVSMPPAWSSSSALYDLDPHHHRLTLLVRDADGNQYLCVMSDRGEPLWTRFLKPLESYRVAIDGASGNIWLLIKNMLDDGKVEVLDADGQLLKSHDINAFTLSYSASDQTFWLGGQRDIKKVDAKDGRVLSTFAMPKEIFSVDQLHPCSDGSVLACEGAHPDLPKSANRIWHIDAQGKLIAAVDIGNLYIRPQAPQSFGRDYIAMSARMNGWLGAYEIESQLIRISGDLKAVRKITKLEDEVVNTDTPGQVWLRFEDKRVLVTWDKDCKVTTREVAVDRR